MAEQGQAILERLTELAKCDANLARLAAEKKSIESAVTAKRQTLTAQARKEEVARNILKEKRQRYQKEEKVLSGEREKLTERRKALATLNNYKLQQTAEKEIDFSLKQLLRSEDGTMALLGEIEAAESELKKLEEGTTALKSELEAFEKDAKERFDGLSSTETDFQGRRADLVKDFPAPTALSQYDRIRTRYPADAVKPLNEKMACTGCNFQVGPQFKVQILKGEIVKCPGCGRILTL